MSLLRIARNVSDLARLASFYCALGFQQREPPRQDPALAALLEVERVTSLHLVSGGQSLELTACEPAGRPYPAEAPANARLFQHIALLTPDIAAAAARALAAGAVPVSRGGPVRLPPASGGVTAWKFRDPDGHPLEYLERAAGEGYDHSAIAAADVAASTRFYTALGLAPRHRQRNSGPEQERLDGVPGAAATIVSLRGAMGPGVELLGYDRIIATPPPAANDIAADRLVIAAGAAGLRRDPDGHLILLAPERG
ncbi:VOC family protein [Acidocella sp.]|uniref:VOC family protein n=1 Tax=Acidocella sp. TaxID=50710 RepID=UPI00261B2B42|nr:VOC family protein [Acidocella sp.]